MKYCTRLHPQPLSWKSREGVMTFSSHFLTYTWLKYQILLIESCRPLAISTNLHDFEADTKTTFVIHLFEPIAVKVIASMHGVLREVTRERSFAAIRSNGQVEFHDRCTCARHLHFQAAFKWAVREHLGKMRLLTLPTHTFQSSFRVWSYHQPEIAEACNGEGWRHHRFPQRCLQPPTQLNNAPNSALASNSIDFCLLNRNVFQALVLNGSTS
mmetsp:Transcript_7014/g.11101  ORF Transcript_7014/g.11101 Transcript_7014/m.11101 type:complete len:213 (-) Transcript_7014:1156-1794(-)